MLDPVSASQYTGASAHEEEEEEDDCSFGFKLSAATPETSPDSGQCLGLLG